MKIIIAIGVFILGGAVTLFALTGVVSAKDAGWDIAPSAAAKDAGWDIAPSAAAKGAGQDISESVAAQAVPGLEGKILLDVQNNGEAWYYDPATLHRYFLGRPADALEIMRFKGLGITNRDLAQIPKDGDTFEGDLALRTRLSGRILLQVEDNGEAWYVNPNELKRYYLGRPSDAFRIMTELGLGITSANLSTIPRAKSMADNILYTVPFTAQAPFGEWSDLRQAEACEEASVLMAMAWVYGDNFSLEQAKKNILAMSEFENKRWGYYIDSSAKDTADRLIGDYYGYKNYEIRYNIGTDQILAQLKEGNLVIVPISGKLINNPYFRDGGPERHMIVIKGYDYSTHEFIVNEPGTRRGDSYRYHENVLGPALRDYPSGEYVAIPEDSPSAMIIIKPNS